MALVAAIVKRPVIPLCQNETGGFAWPARENTGTESDHRDVQAPHPGRRRGTAGGDHGCNGVGGGVCGRGEGRGDEAELSIRLADVLDLVRKRGSELIACYARDRRGIPRSSR